MKQLQIKENEQNQRFDKFLLKYFKKAPKSFIYKMLRKKRIKLNFKKATGSEILNINDTVQIYISEETIKDFVEIKKIKDININFKIIFEDKNILICSKPTNLASQPDIKNKNTSLNDQILYYLYKKNEFNPKYSLAFTPSICNRLDKNTSGIILFGKTLESLQILNNNLKNNNIDKYYLTVVNGTLSHSKKIVLYFKGYENQKLLISSKNNEESKKIITEYEPIKTKNNLTLLKIKLITGKTHQIRATFNHIGFPIIGDNKYGNNEINKIVSSKFNLKNQFLHCYKIKFNNMDNSLNYLSNKEFTSNYICSSFQNVLDFFNFKI